MVLGLRQGLLNSGVGDSVKGGGLTGRAGAAVKVLPFPAAAGGAAGGGSGRGDDEYGDAALRFGALAIAAAVAAFCATVTKTKAGPR